MIDGYDRIGIAVIVMAMGVMLIADGAFTHRGGTLISLAFGSALVCYGGWLLIRTMRGA